MKRPYRTEYYNGPHISSLGHSCSEQGSVRGAVVRIFMQQYSSARVLCDGAVLFNIRRSTEGIQVRYGQS
jgi:hypothetical protein